MRTILLFLSFVAVWQLSAQRVINQESSAEGLVTLSAGISIPKINPGYTLWLPDAKTIHGLVVFTHPRRDTIVSDSLIDYALSKQLAVVYATTDNRLEFFFTPGRMQLIEDYLQEILQTHQIPVANMLYCGMSLEGTRALKLAIFGSNGASRHGLRPKAIAICDAPLDMVRFHRRMVRAKEIEFNEVATNEGSWVSAYLEGSLGGSPKNQLKTYVDYSPYCYTADGGPHLKHLTDIAIRAYTEPDVDWWMETRRKDYYDMNAIDLAALVNELNLLKNEQATLITTRNQGYLPNGARHPHSWSIVDEKELIDWFLTLLD